jgi:hypothetical protein
VTTPSKKLSELNEPERTNVKDYWFLMLSDAMQNEILFGQTVFKMLMLGNGSAIFLICAFIGSSIDTSFSNPLFIVPLACFVVGLYSAGKLLEHTGNITSMIARDTKEQTRLLVHDLLDVDKALHFSFDDTAIKFLRRYKRQSTIALIGGVVITFMLLLVQNNQALYGLFELLNL